MELKFEIVREDTTHSPSQGKQTDSYVLSVYREREYHELCVYTYHNTTWTSGSFNLRPIFRILPFKDAWDTFVHIYIKHLPY